MLSLLPLSYRTTLLFILFSFTTFSFSVASSTGEIEPELLQCSKVHFYKIENPETESRIYLLGSLHGLPLSCRPSDVDAVISSSECLYT